MTPAFCVRVYLCLDSLLLVWTSFISSLWPLLIQHDLILIYYICKESVSKLGQICRFWLDVNSGGMLFNLAPLYDGLSELGIKSQNPEI